jgi:hypothetical protein
MPIKADQKVDGITREHGARPDEGYSGAKPTSPGAGGASVSKKSAQKSVKRSDSTREHVLFPLDRENGKTQTESSSRLAFFLLSVLDPLKKIGLFYISDGSD